MSICVDSKSESPGLEKDLCGGQGHHGAYPQVTLSLKGKQGSPDLLQFLDWSGTVGQEGILLPINILFTGLGKRFSC